MALYLLADLHLMRHEPLLAQAKLNEALRLTAVTDVSPMESLKAVRISPLLSLAGLYLQEGEYVKARGVTDEVVAMTLSQLGAQHPYYGEALSLKALVEAHQGESEKGLADARKAFDVIRATVGYRHRFTADSLAKLALVEAEGRHLGEANKHFEEALSILRGTIGSKHPQYAATSLDYATVLEMQPDFKKKSEDLRRQAASIFQKSH